MIQLINSLERRRLSSLTTLFRKMRQTFTSSLNFSIRRVQSKTALLFQWLRLPRNQASLKTAVRSLNRLRATPVSGWRWLRLPKDIIWLSWCQKRWALSVASSCRDTVRNWFWRQELKEWRVLSPKQRNWKIRPIPTFMRKKQAGKSSKRSARMTFLTHSLPVSEPVVLWPASDMLWRSLTKRLRFMRLNRQNHRC